tara:strand:- start:447 stop:1178 length:732 start_codon:yes stop_codon:yes gene_type:complete
MKKYKPIIIAEIGLNHLGNKDILQKYINQIAKTDVDGISIQILEKNFYKGKYKNFILNNEILKNFIKQSKKKFKYIGVAGDNFDSISQLKKDGMNFVKILSNRPHFRNLGNLKLIQHCVKENIKDIFISTGSNPSLSSLQKLIKKIKSKNISLIHTDRKNRDLKINLNKINILKKEFNLPVSYGNHSNFTETIPNSVFYLPKAIFFYVKLNSNNIIFPDHKHAIKLRDLDKIIFNIKKNIETI